MIFMIFCVFIWCYFWCIFMCSCVLFLVRFSRVFCRAFSGVFSWFCWWYFLCFSGCFFHCILVLFSVHFFVLVPFLFYICFPLVVVLFFCRAIFWCFLGCCFFSVFFLCLLSCFSSCIFSFFLVLMFVLFFRALGGTQDKQPQYFAFWPVRFLVLFLVVTTSEDRKYTRYILLQGILEKGTWGVAPECVICHTRFCFQELCCNATKTLILKEEGILQEHVKNLESDVTSEVTLMSLLTEVTQSLTWSRWKDIQTHLTSLHVWPVCKSLIHFMDHRGSANHLSHVSQTETNGDQSVSVRVFLISCRMIHKELCWNDAGKTQKRNNLPFVTVTICTIRPGRRCPWVLPGLTQRVKVPNWTRKEDEDCRIWMHIFHTAKNNASIFSIMDSITV